MENIEETLINPNVPKVLESGKTQVYIPVANNKSKGVASFKKEHFNVSNTGDVSLKRTIDALEATANPLEKVSLVKLSPDQFETVSEGEEGYDPTSPNGAVLIKKADSNQFGLVEGTQETEFDEEPNLRATIVDGQIVDITSANLNGQSIIPNIVKAKADAATALSTANMAKQTVDVAKETADTALEIADGVLDTVTQNLGTKIYVNGNISSRQDVDEDIQTQFNNIIEKIDDEASDTNKLMPKSYVDDQDYAFIGRVQQLAFNGTLENNRIVGRLDSSISDFKFTPNTQYYFHLYLGIVTLSGELDNSWQIVLEDSDGEELNINTIAEDRLGQTSTVGDMCQIQRYVSGSPTNGYSWDFTGIYREIENNGDTVKVIQSDTIVRETNPSMKGSDFALALIDSTLKGGTTVFITSSYVENGMSYLAGHSYLVNEERVDDDIMLTATDLTPSKSAITVNGNVVEDLAFDGTEDDTTVTLYLDGGSFN